MSFKDKVVIITGSSSGIGAATAEKFAEEKASLILTGRDKERLKNVADKCDVLGAVTLTIVADLTNDEDVKGIVEKAIEKFGKIDVLVNNAGILAYSSLLNGDLMKDFDDIIKTNLRSVVLLTSCATPHLLKTKGNIVNVSSVAGLSFLGSSHDNLAYCIAKAALNHFTKGAASQLSSHGVRVNTVSPGATKTTIFKTAGCDTNWDDMQKHFKLDRITEPEEVGEVIMFLASDKAKSINGSNYVIDNAILLKN